MDTIWKLYFCWTFTSTDKVSALENLISEKIEDIFPKVEKEILRQWQRVYEQKNETDPKTEKPWV